MVSLSDGVVTANSVTLAEQNLCAPIDGKGSLECYVTDSPPGFEYQAERFLGYPPDKVEKVIL